MTDPTPDPSDRELELIARRAELADRFDSTTSDLAAILITRPDLRPGILSALVDDPTSVTMRLLGWIDELMLNRDADDLRLGLEIQARVALAVTPEGLAALE